MMASALKNRNNRSLFHIKICVKMNSRFLLSVLWCCLLYRGLSDVAADEVSVKEGDSVTLHTDVKMNQQVSIKCYFGNTRIAEISANQSKTCTDVQCKDGDERFRDRLKLDHQNGSLTITNTRTTDSGVYQLVINGKNSKSEKIFSVTVHGFFSDGKDGVSVFLMEGDSVTLLTDVKTNQQEDIKWYFYDTRIAQMNGEQRKICTDVQCNKGTERFRDRLKLDNQNGSLTIMNITNTDSGEYELQIDSKSSSVPKSFYFAIHVVPALKLDEMKEGGNVTLYTDVIKNPNDVMTWHFNDILIAGDLSKICSDDECEDGDGRFRDRLKLDHQTGSLTIMNITKTDSGEYKLQMNISRFTIIRNFTFLVASLPSTAGEGTNATGIGGAVIAGVVIGAVVVVVVVVLLIAAVVIYYCHKSCTKPKQEGTTGQDNPREENGEAQRFLPEQNYIEMNDVSGTTTD